MISMSIHLERNCIDSKAAPALFMQEPQFLAASGRGGRIRTGDPLVPKNGGDIPSDAATYQKAPYIKAFDA